MRQKTVRLAFVNIYNIIGIRYAYKLSSESSLCGFACIYLFFYVQPDTWTTTRKKKTPLNRFRNKKASFRDKTDGALI